jgi:hypothetical protein
MGDSQDHWSAGVLSCPFAAAPSAAAYAPRQIHRLAQEFGFQRFPQSTTMAGEGSTTTSRWEEVSDVQSIFAALCRPRSGCLDHDGSAGKR